MKHKVSQLEGALLDAAVAKAEGLPFVIDCDGERKWVMASHPGYSGADDLGRRRVDRKVFSPSTDWRHGGPIIEREQVTIAVVGRTSTYWFAEVGGARLDSSVEVGYSKHQADGPTPLIAAMRAYVASKFGNEVDL